MMPITLRRMLYWEVRLYIFLYLVLFLDAPKGIFALVLGALRVGDTRFCKLHHSKWLKIETQSPNDVIRQIWLPLVQS